MLYDINLSAFFGGFAANGLIGQYALNALAQIIRAAMLNIEYLYLNTSHIGINKIVKNKGAGNNMPRIDICGQS
ncbi:MAG: hypothetical protein IKO36_02225 [Bacteroidaceae bacterium]|nr:hypothetical protein [Bacteroidaceae bacterium]